MEAALIGLCISFVAPLAVGHLLLARAWPKGDAAVLTALARSSLALGLGLGVVAVWVCLWGQLFGIQRGSLAAADATIIALAWLVGRGRPGRASASRTDPGASGWLVLVGVLAAVAVVDFVMLSLAHPHGDGDAILIYNLRARFLAEAWGSWDAVFFGQGLAHVDYPLLVPVLVLRAWVWAGERTPVAPAALAAAFTFATSGVLLGVLAALRNRAAAALATVALLGTPFFVQHGAAQAADVPLAFFVTAAAALWLLHRQQPRAAWLGLLGLAAGCAAWTKNEGVLFAAPLLAGVAVARLRRRRLRDVAVLALGAALPLIVVAGFKLVLAPPNDIAQVLTVHKALARATDLDRWLQTLAALGSSLLSTSPGTLLLGGSHVVLLAYALLAGRSERALPVGWLALLLVAIAFADVAVFVVLSPYQLDWHLRTAMPRLVLQLWPPTLLLAFAWLRVPGETAAGRRHA